MVATAAGTRLLSLQPESVPKELKARCRWVVWLPAQDGDRLTKIPADARTGGAGSSTNPATWSNFRSALACYEADLAPGIGYVLACPKSPKDPYTAIDLDHCIDPATGEIAAWALAIVDQLHSYTERSPSGGGLRIIVKGTLPPGRRKTTKPPKVEMYSSGRFVTITGHRVDGAPATIEERTEQLASLHRKLFPPKTAPSANGKVSHQPHNLSDEDIIRKAGEAKNGDLFRALWAGSTTHHGGDDSAADLALCNLLAFFTGGDRERIDRLFRRSGLMRDKWDRQDYRERTIALALDERTEFYTPRRPPLAHADEEAPSTNGKCPNGGDDEADSQDRPTDAASLDDVVATMRKWLHLPDDGQVKIVLAAYYANLMPGDPVWLLLVGSSGAGKNETLNLVVGLPDVCTAATITEAALLSGTPKKERAAGAKGGLLRSIGPFGILVLRDLTSTLSMNKEQRATLLAALREIHDGRWTRYIGAEGGKELTWEGKLGVIAACTPAIDSFHSVVSLMGERFIYYRVPRPDEIQQSEQALKHTWDTVQMRAEIAEVAGRFFASVDVNQKRPELTTGERHRLASLAALAARCRSAVERDTRHEIIGQPDAETPSRLVNMLARLFAGLLLIGVEREEAWQLIVKVGLDCMPALRRRVLDFVAEGSGKVKTPAVAAAVSHPTSTTRRALEDLAVHEVLIRYVASEEKTAAGKQERADQWELSPIARTHYEPIRSYLTRKVGSCNTVEGGERETSDRTKNTEDDFTSQVPTSQGRLYVGRSGE